MKPYIREEWEYTLPDKNQKSLSQDEIKFPPDKNPEILINTGVEPSNLFPEDTFMGDEAEKHIDYRNYENDQLDLDEVGVFRMGFRNIHNLIKYGQDYIFKCADRLNIEESDDLLTNLKTLYEWEYKYNKVKQSEKTHPKRKEIILRTIKEELSPVIDNIADKLSLVYSNWLSAHALLNPEEWAEGRLTEDQIEEFGGKEVLDIVQGEYERYGGADFERNFFKSSLKYLGQELKEFKYDIVNSLYDDLEYYKEREDEDEVANIQSQIDSLENIDLSTQEDLENFVDMYDIVDIYLVDNFERFSEDPSFDNMVKDFYKDYVFPLWFDHWSSMGIEKTRDTIEELYEELQEINSLNFNEKIVLIHKALTEAHQTGPMMDYISETFPEVSEEDLERLSNLDEELQEYDKELVDMGVWLK